MRTIQVTFLILLISFFCPSFGQALRNSTPNLENWLRTEESIATTKMLANISPPGTAKGVVIASPSLQDPPYFFHWIRDAALTMNTVIDLYEGAKATDQAALKDRLLDYLWFSRGNQTAPSLTGLGEPKFNIDGTAYNGEWCRPQNDGPATRAKTFIRFAKILLAQNQINFVKRELYDGRAPSRSVIKTDLDYVAAHWREPSCDIWEESIGDHLYNRLLQWRALVDGATLARLLQDSTSASVYENQAQQIESEFSKFWDSTRKTYVASINLTGGISYKASNLDSQVILGFLHSEALPFSDTRIQASLQMLASTFASLYPVNRNGPPAPGIGRYPEDRYDGGKNTAGHPWFLITAAFANTYYKSAGEFFESGKTDLANEMATKGDDYLRRVKMHTAADGSLSEQFDRNHGFEKSARDLTWSYAELIQAIKTRQKLKEQLKFY